jgi:cellulose synthase/poly-beta-1,6-N-acetylglucosamine synthase-like glycosyltransferase
LQILLFVSVIYLSILTIAAWFAPKKSLQISDPEQTNFAILIPANNEEVLLPKLLESIQGLEYPKSHYAVHVIADNCTDRTALVAQEYSVNVHIRHNSALIGKGYALQWCLHKIRSTGEKYDAYVFVDADSLLSPFFLEVMHAHVSSGAKVVQGYYGVKDPEISWNISLRYAALALLHYLRPLGRSVFGGSAGLKGNGMLFTPDVLARFPWATSVTEDIEYHMTLLLNGYCVTFAPDAVVWGEMPEKFDQSQNQLDRWESGRLQMARLYVSALVQAAWKALLQKQFRWAYRYIDAMLEHIIPPFSALIGLSILCLALDLLLIILIGFFQVSNTLIIISWWNLVLGVMLVAGQVFYLLSGLNLVNAPMSIYKQLLYAPIFMAKKLRQYLKILSGKKPKSWIKTTRNQV